MTDHGKSDVSKLVRVAQLEWDDDEEAPFAYPPAGFSEVWHGNDGWEASFCDVLILPVCRTKEEAKAAAQSDFEHRILACITTRMENE